jgi:hypothetical protein
MNGKETEAIPVAVRCAFYGRTIIGIEGSNPAKDRVVRPLCLMCVVWVATSAKG